MSAAFAPTGGATVDQFGPSTVHNDDVHNNPHAKLLANDVAIKVAFDILDASVTAGSIGYKFATVAGPQTTTTSYANFVSTSITKQSATSILLVLAKCVMLGSAEAFTTSTYFATLARSGVAISDSESSFSLYNASANAFTNTPFLTTLITGVAAGAVALSLQIKYSGYAVATATLGSLVVFELANVTAL
jgi:hypothetical protein